ncbi:hypothetical protein PIB30_006259 [Stylosanthes scabra]|uniref:Uncharacterized protein n=1 Tax=Stylosanthes scabra TaxID=79078 RepID=A0ABU6Q532_9FABA|nr:hypothetical protein [Stylosanthes scabra]
MEEATPSDYMASNPENSPVDDAAASCVTAALTELTKTMAKGTEAVTAVMNVIQEHANAVGDLIGEMRNCAKIVEACKEAFVRPKKHSTSMGKEVGNARGKEVDEAAVEASEGKSPSQSVHVVDLSGGPPSSNTCGASGK